MELDTEDLPARIQVLKIEAPDTISRELFDMKTVPENWTERPDLTQGAGSRWLASRSSLLLEVPSVLVPEANNVLANPSHPEVSSLKILRRYPWPLDKRLLREVS